ncbi:unnamed protein product [Ixodes pacificus]
MVCNPLSTVAIEIAAIIDSWTKSTRGTQLDVEITLLLTVVLFPRQAATVCYDNSVCCIVHIKESSSVLAAILPARTLEGVFVDRSRRPATLSATTFRALQKRIRGKKKRSTKTFFFCHTVPNAGVVVVRAH